MALDLGHYASRLPKDDLFRFFFQLLGIEELSRSPQGRGHVLQAEEAYPLVGNAIFLFHLLGKIASMFKG